MGILDDAIRQHLELKRQHGADPSDVAKLEHEAFGPIERGDALGGPEPDPAAHETALEEEHSYAEAELEAEEEWGERHAAPAAFSTPDAPPEPVEEAGSVAYEPPPVERPRVAAQPLPPVEDVDRTVEFDALADQPDPQPDPGPGEHDELEETPDFLEETPEHDRLWFEQKPPRDFDF